MATLNDISSNNDEQREATEVAELEYAPLEKVSILAKFLGIFGIEPDAKGAVRTVWEEVIQPTFLDGCRDAMYTLGDYFFGGGTGGKRSRSSGGKGNTKHTSYGNKFKGSNASVGKAPGSVAYDITYYDDDESTGRDKAYTALQQVQDVIEANKFCTVEDYILIGRNKTTSNYMFAEWGWYGRDLDGVRPTRTGDGGWRLNLPKPRPKEKD